jgi:hypothetical protein
MLNLQSILELLTLHNFSGLKKRTANQSKVRMGVHFDDQPAWFEHPLLPTSKRANVWRSVRATVRNAQRAVPYLMQGRLFLNTCPSTYQDQGNVHFKQLTFVIGLFQLLKQLLTGPLRSFISELVNVKVKKAYQFCEGIF